MQEAPMSSSPHRRIANHRTFFVLCAFSGVLTLTASSPVGAAVRNSKTFAVQRLQTASGPTPFQSGCPGGFHDDEKVDDLEIEPAIAVNPANPRTIVATWKQDVSGPFNARDDVVASSQDGGRTWSRTTVPGLTRCSGGTADTASDPWVSFGGDGTAYFGGQAGLMSSDPPPIAIVASHSSDGGRHWTSPTTVAAPRGGNEQPAVTASLTRRGHAYMIWSNFFKAIPAPTTYTVEFSRTIDGGATWSKSVVVSEPGALAIDLAPRIRILPNGALLAIFGRADFATGIAEIRVARSVDEGRSWQPAVVAGSIPLPGEVVDPESGEQLPQPGYPTSAVGPDGTVYIAFENSTSAASGAIGLLISRDGGQSWATSTLPDVSAFAFEPVIAVDGHGIVGVTWYDLRNDRPGDAATTGDVWFAHSEDSGASWHQIHVAGPTDLRSAAPPELNRFGEYQGLAGLHSGFAAIFGLAAPQARYGLTDIFFAKIAPVGCDGDHQGNDGDC
jgi:hypothetical protein